MTMKVRALLTLTITLVTMGLSGCGHYTCGTTFGNSTCNSSGGGLGGGGNGSGNAAYVYYVGTGLVGGLQLDSAQALTAIPNFGTISLPSTYLGSGIIVAGKKFLYIPFTDTAQLFAWSISSTGALTAVSGSPFAAPWAAGMAQGVEPLKSSIIASPDGSYLFIADAADSQIRVFTIDATTGVPTELSNSPFSTVGLLQPWNLSTDGLGHFLYVTEGNVDGEGLAMAVFTINAGTGALSGGTLLPSNMNMWQVQGDPSGKFMIGTKGETGNHPSGLIDKALHVFNINQATGVLTETQTVTTNNGPTGILIHPNGKFVYDFNVSNITNFDGPADGFQLDPTTGALTLLAGSPFTNLSPQYGGYFDQSGKYIFVHSNGHIGVWTVDATTGNLTELTTGVNGVGDKPWTVTDPH
jgi:6-phosphogluconolactonase (cycloisomerase 2 family)